MLGVMLMELRAEYRFGPSSEGRKRTSQGRRLTLEIGFCREPCAVASIRARPSCGAPLSKNNMPPRFLCAWRGALLAIQALILVTLAVATAPTMAIVSTSPLSLLDPLLCRSSDQYHDSLKAVGKSQGFSGTFQEVPIADALNKLGTRLPPSVKEVLRNNRCGRFYWAQPTQAYVLQTNYSRMPFVVCVASGCIPWGSFDPKKDDPERTCATLARGFTETVTNASTQMLAAYPDPTILISHLYIQFNNPAHLRRPDPKGDLLTQKKKIQASFPGATPVRYNNGLGKNRNEETWRIKLAAPTPLSKVALQVDDAIVRDRASWSDNSPNREETESMACQLKKVQADIPVEPQAAIVNYNDPSLVGSSRLTDQNEYTVMDPAERLTPSTQWFAWNASATEILAMHKAYAGTQAQAAAAGKVNKVRVGVLDSNVVPEQSKGLGHPSFVKVHKKPLKIGDLNPGHEKFEHGYWVSSVLAAPSNDGIGISGAISNEAAKNIDLYYYQALPFILNDREFSHAEMLGALGGVPFFADPNISCLDFFSCWTKDKKQIIADDEIPHILNKSLGNSFKTGFFDFPGVGGFVRNVYRCGGSAEAAYLEARKVKFPIVASGGNGPDTHSSTSFGCSEFIVSVFGLSYHGELDSRASRPVRDDEQGAYVGAPYNVLVQLYPSASYEASRGSSFSAPLVAGAVATMMTRLGEEELKQVDAKKMYGWLMDSTKFRVNSQDDPRPYPILNARCLFSHVSRSTGVKPPPDLLAGGRYAEVCSQ